MLSRFSVKNFKGFKEEIVLDLKKTNNYEFNSDAVNDGIVNKALIYGKNGCGKSNLGLALFDLVLHLTDKNKMLNKYLVYLNQDTDTQYATFDYVFTFGADEIEYKYTKFDMQNLRTEELYINGQQYIWYDFVKKQGSCLLDGTQSLRFDSPDSKLSKLKFINNNAILVDNKENQLFYKMMSFVDSMLLFYSLMERGYQGFMIGIENLDDSIVKSGKLNDFEKFLHKADVMEKLVYREVNGQNEIAFQYKKSNVPMQIVASTGTKSLELFYYWYIKIQQASLVFIDEFDAFYHFELSEMIIRELMKIKGTQVILTTHNTDLMSNDLLRPDCLFNMTPSSIVSFANSTKKELRKAHNIQKMYKAGAFDE